MKIIVHGILWLRSAVAICFFAGSLMCGCGTSGQIVPQIASEADSGQDAEPFNPAASGARVQAEDSGPGSCVDKCHRRMHDEDCGGFDYVGCVKGCRE